MLGKFSSTPQTGFREETHSGLFHSEKPRKRAGTGPSTWGMVRKKTAHGVSLGQTMGAWQKFIAWLTAHLLPAPVKSGYLMLFRRHFSCYISKITQKYRSMVFILPRELLIATSPLKSASCLLYSSQECCLSQLHWLFNLSFTDVLRYTGTCPASAPPQILSTPINTEHRPYSCQL